MKSCPHCGRSLPEEASFCPCCAQTVNVRKGVCPPRYIPGRVLYSTLIAFAAAAVLVLLAFGARSRPKVYDNGNAEVIYTSQGTAYQLCVAWADAPFQPAHQRYANGRAVRPMPTRRFWSWWTISFCRSSALISVDFPALMVATTLTGKSLV